MNRTTSCSVLPGQPGLKTERSALTISWRVEDPENESEQLHNPHPLNSVSRVHEKRREDYPPGTILMPRAYMGLAQKGSPEDIWVPFSCAESRRYQYEVKWPHTKAKSVYVSSNYNNWGKDPLWEKDGVWHGIIDIFPGKLVYKFIVDGNWWYDITLPNEVDPCGAVNNVDYIDPNEYY